MDRTKTKKSGFTLIELMIIVGIIGLLAVIAIVSWASSAQKKAAVSSYKTTMNSVTTAVEMCVGTGGSIYASKHQLDPICNGVSSAYPEITAKCGDTANLHFCASGSPSNWTITTSTDPNDCSSTMGWYCKGCRVICSASGCTKDEQTPGACF